MLCPGISIEIPINSVLSRNSILAYFDDPLYRRSSGITKYGTIGVGSIVKKEDMIEYRKADLLVLLFFFVKKEDLILLLLLFFVFVFPCLSA